MPQALGDILSQVSLSKTIVFVSSFEIFSGLWVRQKWPLGLKHFHHTKELVTGHGHRRLRRPLLRNVSHSWKATLASDHWSCPLWGGQHSSCLPWTWGIKGPFLGCVYTQNLDIAPGLVHVFVERQKSLCATKKGVGHEKSANFLWALGYALTTPEFTGLKSLSPVSALEPKVRRLDREADALCSGLKPETQSSTAFLLKSGTVEHPSNVKDVCLESLSHESFIRFARASLNYAFIMYCIFVKPIHKYLLAFSSEK